MIRSSFFIMLTLIFSVQVYGESNGKLIPRSYPEKCKYYLVKSEVRNGILRVTHKQVCPKNEFYSGVGFSLTDINCKRRKYKGLGYGDDSISNIKLYPSAKWTDLVAGSSRSDLVNFVCK